MIDKQRAWRDDWALRFCWSLWGSLCRINSAKSSQCTRVLQFDEKEKKERSVDITFTGLDYQFSPWCSKVMFTLNNCNGDDKSALLWFRNWTLVSNHDHSVKRIISKNIIRDGGSTRYQLLTLPTLLTWLTLLKWFTLLTLFTLLTWGWGDWGGRRTTRQTMGLRRISHDRPQITPEHSQIQLSKNVPKCPHITPDQPRQSQDHHRTPPKVSKSP